MHSFVYLLIGHILCLSVIPAHAQTALSNAEALTIHDRLLTIDTHIDIGAGYGTVRLDPAQLNHAQVNLPSMRIGGLDVGFFVVFTPQGEQTEEGYRKAADDAEEKYRSILRMLRANPNSIGLATTPEEIEALNADGKLVALIGMENTYPLGSTAEEVRKSVALWANRGVRYASITHFGHNQFGGSSNPSKERNDGDDPGLRELGGVLISALNDWGIMVDVSHVGPRTTADAIAISGAPVIASHSTAKALYDNPRGLTDEQMLAIKKTGGVVQITAYRSYLADIDPKISAATSILRERLGLTSFAAFESASQETLAEFKQELTRIREKFDDVTLEQFLDHVEHAVEVVGIDHVGLSGDFDGGGGVEGWDSAAETPNVTASLLSRGYSEQDLAKLWGGNLLRVMRSVQSAAAQ